MCVPCRLAAMSAIANSCYQTNPARSGPKSTPGHARREEPLYWYSKTQVVLLVVLYSTKYKVLCVLLYPDSGNIYFKDHYI